MLPPLLLRVMWRSSWFQTLYSASVARAAGLIFARLAADMARVFAWAQT